jgi:hypothetical protein
MPPRSTIVDFDCQRSSRHKDGLVHLPPPAVEVSVPATLVLCASQGYNIRRSFVIRPPGISHSRSIDLPSVRSLPTAIDQRVCSESRDVPPDSAFHSKTPFNLSAIKHTIYLFHRIRDPARIIFRLIKGFPHILTRQTARHAWFPHQSQSRRPARHIAGLQTRNSRSGIVFAQS